jgi:hypothetical protein
MADKQQIVALSYGSGKAMVTRDMGRGIVVQNHILLSHLTCFEDEWYGEELLR